jgi:glycerol-3-phosphate acyltransferase PlsY
MPGSADLAGLPVPVAVVAAAGYLLGSLPFGFLVARSRGVDIFQVGSRNPGATNVRRVLGRGPGNAVFALDALKGAVAAGWPLVLAWGALRAPPGPDTFGYIGLGFAVLGHSYSCFTRFRGGKGVSTAAGGLFVLMPPVGLAALAIWAVVFLVGRYVSLASIVAAVSLPALAYGFGRGRLALGVSGAIAAFVVIRHRSNLARLANGTEKRFERRPPADKDPGATP